MRTTLILPAKLMNEAKRAIGAKTKTETIIRGLEELIRLKNVEGLLALRGKIQLAIDLNKSRERQA